MDADSFNELALRVITGEATDEERRALDTEITARPELIGEFAELKRDLDLLRTTAPMTAALGATQPELPAYRAGELRTAVRQHFGPAANRRAESAKSGGILPALRWIFAGGGVTALAIVAVIFLFANQSIEIGLYRTDLVRSGDSALTASDVPTARLIPFDQDDAFDKWQNQSLGWSEHAKIWIDNEHDLLHFVHRDRIGHVVTETQPLAPTSQAQRDQIKQVVAALR